MKIRLGIGRTDNLGQSASTSDKRESASLVRARETWSGADLGRDHGAETAEQHLRGLLKAAQTRIVELEARVAELESKLAKKRRTRKPRAERVADVRQIRRAV